MYAVSIMAIGIIGGAAWSISSFNRWSNDWELKIQNPIQNFIKIEPRTHAKARIISVAEAYEMTTNEYICHVFGSECKTALAVSLAENRRQKCDIIVIEPNKTVSLGLFQINSVHFGKFAPVDLLDCKGNIRAAKELRDKQGWGIWSTYSNGSYKK